MGEGSGSMRTSLTLEGLFQEQRRAWFCAGSFEAAEHKALSIHRTSEGLSCGPFTARWEGAWQGWGWTRSPLNSLPILRVYRITTEGEDYEEWLETEDLPGGRL